MSTAEHTPGEWEHDGAHVHAVNGSVVNIAVCDLSMNGANWSGTDYTTASHCEANARLIAAAPELLAACKRLLVEVRWESMRADVVTDQARADIALAEAAIAKATGSAA